MASFRHSGSSALFTSAAIAAAVALALGACSDDESHDGGDDHDDAGADASSSTGGSGGGGGGGGEDSAAPGSGGAAPEAGPTDGGAFDEGYDDPSTVTITDGEIEGRKNGASHRFLGIPYAQPPVGDLRWKAPVKNDAWDGVLDATEFGGRCAQASSIQNPEPSENEDCLYLNVWTPDPKPTELKPVLFWIHGGGNVTGAASDPVPLGIGRLFYNGRSFAETHDMVVVTINYRLGLFGFFSHPALRAEGSPSGNQGLYDQHLALEWVRDNIEAFGGDKDNVTVFGESAGSFDTCFHVASPTSAGLFEHAVSESGGCTTRLTLQSEAEASAARFVEAAGCDSAADALDCLRGKSVSALTIQPPVRGSGADAGIAASDAGAALPGGDFYQGTTPLWSFGPVVDGEILPDQPRTLFDDGSVNQVDYILGSNTDEGTLFHLGATEVADEAEYLEALERAYGAAASDVAAAYPLADYPSPNDALVRITGDSRLVCGTHDTARRAAAAGLNVYMYNFDLPIAVAGFESLGAVHGAEIVYVFNDIDMWPDPVQETVSETVHGYWARFGQTGDPNGGGAPTWPKFSVDSDQRMQFGETTEVVDDFRADECAFWRTRYDAAFQ